MTNDKQERPDDLDPRLDDQVTPDDDQPSAARDSGDDFWDVKRDDDIEAAINGDEAGSPADALSVEEQPDVRPDEPADAHYGAPAGYGDPIDGSEPPAQPSYGMTPDGYGAPQSDYGQPSTGDPYGPPSDPWTPPGAAGPNAGEAPYGQTPYGAPNDPFGHASYGPPAGGFNPDQFAGGPANAGMGYGGAFSGPQDVPPQDDYAAYGTPYGQAGYEQAPYGAPTMAYASWGKRLKAALLDIFLPFLVLGAIITPFTQGTNPAELSGETSLFQALVQWTLLGLLWGFVSGNTGQTPGRKWANTMLVGEDGQPIGTGRTIAHYALHTIDSVACGIGFLWPLWDAKRQTFSDKILKTYVIDLNAQSNPYSAPYQQPYPQP